jgi:hypothetical protein
MVLQRREVGWSCLRDEEMVGLIRLNGIYLALSWDITNQVDMTLRSGTVGYPNYP